MKALEERMRKMNVKINQLEDSETSLRMTEIATLIMNFIIGKDLSVKAADISKNSMEKLTNIKDFKRASRFFTCPAEDKGVIEAKALFENIDMDLTGAKVKRASLELLDRLDSALLSGAVLHDQREPAR